MDIKKLKTSELLDMIQGEEDCNEWGKLIDEIHERSPFEDIYFLFEELEKKVDKLIKKVEDVENTSKNHAHLDGTVVVKVNG